MYHSARLNYVTKPHITVRLFVCVFRWWFLVLDDERFKKPFLNRKKCDKPIDLSKSFGANPHVMPKTKSRIRIKYVVMTYKRYVSKFYDISTIPNRDV